MANLGAEDLWHIGNTRWPQFTAHYLAHPPLRLAFSSASVIHRRLLFADLEPFPPFFFRFVYRRSRDFLCLCLYFFPFPAYSNPNFAISFIFLVFSFILLFLCFFSVFSLFPFFFFFQYYYLIFFSLFPLSALSFSIFFII